MSKKVVIGLKDQRLVFMDLDTSKKVMRSAITEGCDAVFITALTDEIKECWDEELPVDLKIEKLPFF